MTFEQTSFLDQQDSGQGRQSTPVDPLLAAYLRVLLLREALRLAEQDQLLDGGALPDWPADEPLLTAQAARLLAAPSLASAIRLLSSRAAQQGQASASQERPREQEGQHIGRKGARKRREEEHKHQAQQASSGQGSSPAGQQRRPEQQRQRGRQIHREQPHEPEDSRKRHESGRQQRAAQPLEPQHENTSQDSGRQQRAAQPAPQVGGQPGRNVQPWQNHEERQELASQSGRQGRQARPVRAEQQEQDPRQQAEQLLAETRDWMETLPDELPSPLAIVRHVDALAAAAAVLAAAADEQSRAACQQLEQLRGSLELIWEAVDGWDGAGFEAIARLLSLPPKEQPFRSLLARTSPDVVRYALALAELRPGNAGRAEAMRKRLG